MQPIPVERFEQAKRFELLIVDLLIELGKSDVKYQPRHTVSRYVKLYPDITFTSEGALGVVEVKLYRVSSPPSFSTVRDAYRQLKNVKDGIAAVHGILVMSCRAPHQILELLVQNPELEVWDIEVLFSEARRFPHIYKQLLVVLELDDETAFSYSEPPVFDNVQPQTLGKQLSERLLNIQSGRANAYKFEDICIECLKYLFERDLVGWHEQHETSDELNRRDLVCRILPIAEVWKFLSSDLKSRYVVFEFKNYSEALTQKEIVTTERYLFPTALRNVAVIISPHGCKESAQRVIQGAMREHGKLIVSLTSEEVARLLCEKDTGGDPNTYLFELVDQLLLGLGR